MYKWTTLHANSCSARGWSWPLHIPEVQKNRWYKALVPREAELVCKAELESGVTSSDVGQTWGRTRDGKGDWVITALPGAQIWYKKKQRFLIGRDLLSLQGFPWESLECVTSFSEHQLADLAGNSFSSSVALACDVALMANVSYCKKRELDRSSIAMQLVKLIGGQSQQDDDEGDSDW